MRLVTSVTTVLDKNCGAHLKCDKISRYPQLLCLLVLRLPFVSSSSSSPEFSLCTSRTE